MKRAFLLLLLWGFFCEASSPKTVLIVCDSVTKHTWTLAESIAEGALSVADTQVLLQTPAETRLEDLLNADAIIVGSPVHAGNPTPAILKFLSTCPIKGELKNKIGAAFTTGGGIAAGLEGTLFGILRAMLTCQMIVVGGDEWRSAFGAYAVTNQEPYQLGNKYEEDFMLIAKKFGTRVAELAQTLEPK